MPKECTCAECGTVFYPRKFMHFCTAACRMTSRTNSNSHQTPELAHVGVRHESNNNTGRSA